MRQALLGRTGSERGCCYSEAVPAHGQHGYRCYHLPGMWIPFRAQKLVSWNRHPFLLSSCAEGTSVNDGAELLIA